MSSKLHHRRGFTLVELLVVIGIIGTLVALLLPALSAARTASNAAASGNNLSTFGRGFEVFASSNDGAYTTGAFDHFRDGDIRTNGWVGDLISIKVANAGKSLDPAHRSKLCETVGDYSGVMADNQANIAEGIAADRWPAATDATTVSGATHFGGASQARDMWREGYNTNYLTTWHFSRGDPTDAVDGFNDVGLKGMAEGDGPLSQNFLASKINTSASRIALMAPSRPIAADRGLVEAADATALRTFAGAPIATANDRMTASFTEGMIVPYTDVDVGGAADQFVHDFSTVMPLHAPKTSDGFGGFAPVLFADLHVEKVFDKASTGEATIPDGFIGNNADLDELDEDTYSEVTDAMWIKRLRNPLN